MVPGRGKGRNVNGIILLDKAKGESSNHALQRIKRLFHAKKAGHTGSLDPLATGVLPLCLGEATKISQFLLDSDKRYMAKVKLGERTDSGDSEGVVIDVQRRIDVDYDALVQTLTKFEGEIKQLPPMYSALKHRGVPLYKLARKGISIKRKVRAVTIHKIGLMNFDNNIAEIDVTCSKGTYIRTLADDLGQELGCGAHVIELRRLQAGVFSIDQCRDSNELETIKESFGLSGLDKVIVPMERAVEKLPEVVLASETARDIRNGQAVSFHELPKSGLVRLYEKENFIGIGTVNADGEVAPKRLVAAKSLQEFEC
ncbi:MAG: tRNA pseudouridine(55) synthase TruB [Gammaproteobacteria bacterium]|nr:tRNA pseudouridine(55) synthase TruB [Gammaproteobacteria bacterium]